MCSLMWFSHLVPLPYGLCILVYYFLMPCHIYTTFIAYERERKRGRVRGRERTLVRGHALGMPTNDMLAKYFSIEQKSICFAFSGFILHGPNFFFGDLFPCNSIW